MRRVIEWFVIVLSTALAACGGGGGGSTAGDNSGSTGFPVLVTSASFQLPAIDAPPEHTAAAGQQRGQLLLPAGAGSVAGLQVELLDATTPATPVRVASTLTGSDGSFNLGATAGSTAPVDQWLRVTLADGSSLRAYATGWTEIGVGSEVTVAEITRLRRAGAFSAHVLATSELAAAQQSASLLWLSRPAALTPASAVAEFTVFLRVHAAWNQLLDRFALAAVSQGAGDVAGFVPVAEVSWPSSVVGGSAPTASFSIGCVPDAPRQRRNCSLGSQTEPDLGELWAVDDKGISIRTSPDATDVLSQLLDQVGELPLLAFPHAVGTVVLYDNSRVVLQADSAWRAAVKITRRTYPAASLPALGGTVPAVQVVLDYAFAVLDTRTGQQTDVLARERRWFSPAGGRVRLDLTGLARTGTQETRIDASVVANAVNGSVFAAAAPPFAGIADVAALALRHRHAVHATASNRIYAATPAAGGQILELDGDSLATLRTLSVPAVPGRLAVSADGSRLYAGLDGGQVHEFALPGLVPVRQFSLPADPYGQAYDRVYGLEADPFDASRVLVLAGSSSVFGGSGAVLVYRAGVLALRDAPRYFAFDYGWGYYSPNQIAWTSTPDEFLAAFLGSPQSLYRFRAGATAVTEVATLDRVQDLGIRDLGGEILTTRGKILDATAFAPLRTLGLAPFQLNGCQWMQSGSALCDLDTGTARAPPVLLHIDAADGGLRGAYRPAIDQVVSGCPEVGVRVDSLGLDDARRSAMADGRSLISSLADGNGSLCMLQVWALRGVAR